MKKTLFVALAATVALLATSCKKEMPKAVFEYSFEGLTVSFVNQSKNADSYKWEFGDGQTSAETNPKHTYAQNGTYTVCLTATNKNGSNQFTDVVSMKVAAIKIDGDFTDWDVVIANKKAAYTQMETGTDYAATYLKKFGAYMDADNLYFMVAFTKDSVRPLDVYIGCSGELEEPVEPCTSIWNPVYIDYLVEFGYGDQFETVGTKFNWYDWSYATLFQHDKEVGGWAWTNDNQPIKKGQNTFTTMSQKVEKDGLVYAECKLSRSNFVFAQGINYIYIGACTNYAEDDGKTWTTSPTGIAPAATVEVGETVYQPQLKVMTVAD